MITLQQLVYLTLCFLAIYAEVSTKINTDNVVKKAGLGLVAVGSIINLYHEGNLLMPAGFIIFLLPNALNTFRKYQQRRASDL